MNIQHLIKTLELLNDDKKDESHSWQIGKNYFIRTVTMNLTGKLERVHATELVLSRAAWIADSGRFHDALKCGSFSEVEPFVNDVILNRASVIDATVIDFSLPTEQK